MKYLLQFLCFALLTSCGMDDGPIMPPTQTNPRVTIEDLAVEEGDENKFIFVRLVLDKRTTNLGTVRLSSEDVTAVAGQDYIGFSDIPVVFEPDDLVKEFRIEIIGDIEAELNEVFNVNIASAEDLGIEDLSLIHI